MFGDIFLNNKDAFNNVENEAFALAIINLGVDNSYYENIHSQGYIPGWCSPLPPPLFWVLVMSSILVLKEVVVAYAHDLALLATGELISVN